MMLEQYFFKDDNYEVIKVEEKDSIINIYVKSHKESCECPKCGMVSTNRHSTYIRSVQDTPIHNTETWLSITSYEFECENENCETITFNEVIPFVRKNKVKTDSLIQFILSVSMFLSSSCASLVLSCMGVKVSADTIDNIIQSLEVVDDPDIEEIGIDDVAKRKGLSYATAIYSIKDHHLIALLDGRDADTVKEWLKKHKKIKTVARDRASAYATAINEILPECMQVADRFHLFENLIKYLKDIFYAEMPEKIFIKNNEIVDSKEIKKVPEELINVDESVLNQYDYDNSVPVDDNDNEISFDNKKHDLDSKQYIEQDKRRIEKKNKIVEIRKEIANSPDVNEEEIANKYKICKTTLNKYKNMTDSEVEQLGERKNYKKRTTKMDNYINILYKMIRDKIDLNYIIAYLIMKGYDGSIRNLKSYIYLIAKNNNLPYEMETDFFSKMVYPNDVIVFTKSELLKYILTINENKYKDERITDNFDLIIEKYPIVKEIQNAFKDFHETIFSKNPEQLDFYIDKYNNTIPSFCNGLKMDIAAVKNAISSDINSGFVEGNNNKFKLIKRIVYGKQKIVNLFKRCYLCFMATNDNFDINEMVNLVLESN